MWLLYANKGEYSNDEMSDRKMVKYYATAEISQNFNATRSRFGI